MQGFGVSSSATPDDGWRPWVRAANLLVCAALGMSGCAWLQGIPESRPPVQAPEGSDLRQPGVDRALAEARRGPLDAAVTPVADTKPASVDIPAQPPRAVPLAPVYVIDLTTALRLAEVENPTIAEARRPSACSWPSSGPLRF